MSVAFDSLISSQPSNSSARSSSPNLADEVRVDPDLERELKREGEDPIETETETEFVG